MEGKKKNDTKERAYGLHVIQYPHDVSFCAGCSACEVICALVHEGRTGPLQRRIFVDRDNIDMVHKIYTCQQCLDHPCYNACPKKDKAFCIDEEKQITYINPEECISCGLCIKACPFEPKRLQFDNTNKRTRKVIKCDLCRTRPEGPACIEYCQVRCLGLSNQPAPKE
jgi:Fe-S-cluster-containing hydrogenase component 2